eukprot:TRINITY_DN2593_c0_g1_i1.p2 TRINITY_DN2593_c0_g1~~TRINITY_DN2593_c0_g1_i1.p2  ORF type:complete len:123 (+),score=15.86 TRINITY_DN2593_c0_g1_i1:136-504(+)
MSGLRASRALRSAISHVRSANIASSRVAGSGNSQILSPSRISSPMSGSWMSEGSSGGAHRVTQALLGIRPRAPFAASLLRDSLRCLSTVPPVYSAVASAQLVHLLSGGGEALLFEARARDGT